MINDYRYMNRIMEKKYLDENKLHAANTYMQPSIFIPVKYETNYIEKMRNYVTKIKNGNIHIE